MASAGYSGGKGGCGGGACYGAGSASYGKGATSYGAGSSYGKGSASYGQGNRPSAYGSNTQMYGKLGASSMYAQNGGKSNPGGLYGKIQGLNTKNGLYSTSGGMPAFLMGLMKGYQNAKNGTDGAKPYKTAPRPDQPDQKYNPGKENQDPREDEHKCPRCGGFSLFGAVCPPCK